MTEEDKILKSAKLCTIHNFADFRIIAIVTIVIKDLRVDATKGQKKVVALQPFQRNFVSDLLLREFFCGGDKLLCTNIPVVRRVCSPQG